MHFSCSWDGFFQRYRIFFRVKFAGHSFIQIPQSCVFFLRLGTKTTNYIFTSVKVPKSSIQNFGQHFTVFRTRSIRAFELLIFHTRIQNEIWKMVNKMGRLVQSPARVNHSWRPLVARFLFFSFKIPVFFCSFFYKRSHVIYSFDLRSVFFSVAGKKNFFIKKIFFKRKSLKY